MSRVARVIALIIGVAPLGGDPPVARAAPDPTAAAERKGEQAREAYRAGHYDRAIALYFEANDIAASAGFLFNVAFIYDRKLNDPDLALQYYRKVERFPGADPAVAAKARGRIEELVASGVAPPPPGGAAEPGGGASDPDTAADPTADRGSGGGASNGAQVSGGDDLVPWLLIGGGGALLATGIVFGVGAVGTERDYHAATAPARRADLRSQGQDEALLADLFMVGGVVAAGTGIVLMLLGDDAPSDRASVHVAPAPIGQGGVGLTLTGRL